MARSRNAAQAAQRWLFLSGSQVARKAQQVQLLKMKRHVNITPRDQPRDQRTDEEPTP
jgi:hypothetical protein